MKGGRVSRRAHIAREQPDRYAVLNIAVRLFIEPLRYHYESYPACGPIKGHRHPIVH